MNDDMYDKMRRISENRRNVEDVKRREIVAKSKLSRVLEKKFKTTFIGAISAIEEEFGFLWGRDIENIERTPQEREWFARWQSLRTIILNNGNTQLRAVLNELQQYSVQWQGYKLNLPFKGGEENRAEEDRI